VSKKQSRDTSAFGSQLRALRKHRKITMKKLAENLSVSESYISRLESGERHPDKELILKMGTLLFPEGNAIELDRLLIAADYTPVNLEHKTGHDDVVEHFQQIIEKNADNFRAYNALIILLIKQGKLTAAQQRIEAGLKRFDNSVQLVVLKAALKLAEGKFDQAVVLQKEALTLFRSYTPPTDLFIKESDLLYNLGDMYFAQGYAAIDRYLQHRNLDDYSFAKKQLAQASESLQEALVQDPDNILILDEHAKVLFNQAYLEESAGKEASYTHAIEAFEWVIHSEHKHLLNYSNLMESMLSLVHAHAKSGHFAVAQQYIDIVECCLPNYWLVHYIKACVYGLLFLKASDDSDYRLGMKSLERACLSENPQNRTRQEAPYDPDLAPLKNHNKKAFKTLMNLETYP
jgi:transcriptional regulator with XRE-family HTH domain